MDTIDSWWQCRNQYPSLQLWAIEVRQYIHFPMDVISMRGKHAFSFHDSLFIPTISSTCLPRCSHNRRSIPNNTIQVLNCKSSRKISTLCWGHPLKSFTVLFYQEGIWTLNLPWDSLVGFLDGFISGNPSLDEIMEPVANLPSARLLKYDSYGFFQVNRRQTSGGDQYFIRHRSRQIT